MMNDTVNRRALRVGLILGAAACVLTFTAGGARGADPDDLAVRRSPVTGLATFVTAADGTTFSVPPTGGRAQAVPLDFFVAHGALFGVTRPAEELRLQRTRTDALGQVHTTYRQVYRDVTVFTGELKVHQDAAGGFRVVNGDFFPLTGKLNVRPALSADAAAMIARANLLAGNATIARSALTIVDPGWYGDSPRGEHLAWHLELVDAAHGVAEAFLIDAHNGEVLDQWSLIQHARDRKIYDGGGGPGLPGVLVRAEGGPATGIFDEDAAYDYYGDTYDYFARAFGRDSIDDAGLTMVATVNSTAPTCPNAFWTDLLLQMVFCDGAVTDDIVGHELTHGVTSFSNGLIYQNQPGQLNESFSDVFGELIDLFNGDAAFVGVIGGPPNWPAHATGAGLDAPNNARTACSFSPGHADGVRWLVGEDAAVFGGAIRDMWDPTCYDDPDRANSAMQSCSNGDNGGVHSGSGVPNHAFAMLTDGKSFNGYTVTGIGPIKAGAVWYRALTVYLTSGADFEDAYWAFNQAAADLVGTTPNDPRTGGPSASAFTAADAIEVDEALLAVEMNTPGRCGDEPPVVSSVPPAECGVQTVILEEDFESGLAGWSVSHSAMPTPYDWITTSGLPFARPGSAAFGADLSSSCAFGPDESGAVHLDSPVINLPGSLDFPTLAFTHFMDSEANWDGGNVWISVNAGPWQSLPASAFYYNAYNRTLFTVGQGNSNPLAGEECFTGSGGQWGTSLVHLGGLVAGGDAIRIRFDMGKDGCSGTDGWYVDDVRVYDCTGAGDCNSNGIPDEVETLGGGHLDVRLSNPSGHGSGYFTDADLGPSGFVVVRAQHFTLFAPTTIDSIRFWGGYYPNNTPPTDDLTVIFHADGGGFPGAAVSTQLSVPVTRALSGFSIGGVDEWEFVTELPIPVSLAAGDYWIEIFNDTTGDDDTFFWSGSSYNIGLVRTAWSAQAPGAAWNTSEQTFNLAIELIAGVVGTDCNANGIPDECEPAYDCNVNGVPDICDIAGGTSDDCNANSVPDACDLVQRKLVGANSSFYLELDAATGSTMAVSGLGLGGFGNVAGLAYDPTTDTLYGTDTVTDQLVAIDPNTGVASAVGALGFAFVSGLAFDPGTSTIYGTDTVTDQLIWIDSATGAGTAIGALGFGTVAGLAYDPNSGTLYGTDTTTDQLIVIDPLTGAGTAVGALGFDYVEGLAFDPTTGTLYGSDPVADQLLIINPATGAATAAGSLSFGSVVALAVDPNSGALYGADTSTNQLISIDPGESATAVGPLGFSSVTSLAFNPNTNQLYGVDGATDQLLLINPLTGAGTVIGPIGFSQVEGLAFNPNTNILYGTDVATDRLITINRFTGLGSSVGPLGFNNVYGLAFDSNSNTLYGTDISTDQLITINRFTGQGTAVGPLGFGNVHGLEFDPNSNTLYGADISTDELITINPATGQGSAVSALGFPFVAGLGFDPNTDTLYGADLATDQLMVIEPPSNLGTAIGALGFAQVEGLAYDPGADKLFGTETSKDQLVIIDPVTGSATAVGPLGFSNVQGLAFDPLTGTLYGTDVTTDQLLTIDPVTGTGTAIGALGFAQVSGLAFDPTTGTLYGADVTTDQLITIDPLTGAGSAVGPLGFGNVFGLAFDETTGTLYGADLISDELIVIDPITGGGTLVGGPVSVNGLAFDPTRGTLFGSSNLLMTIGPANGQGTAVGELGFSSVHGLAFDPVAETVYGSDINTDQLIAIDPETGAGRSVGALGFGQVEGLAFDPDTGTLYGTDVATDQLIIIDPMTGAGTAVGALGFGSVHGLAFDSLTGILYGTDIVADELITIDTQTGAGATVGPLGFGNVQGLAYHPLTGTLYGTDITTEQLIRINPATGNGTVVGPTQFADIYGLALVESVNDCNVNGTPDECELEGDDCNSNGIPDECEPDCNNNGVADECDITLGASDDCQPDGVPDECQLGSLVDLVFDNGFADLVSGIVPSAGWTNAGLADDFDLVPGASTVRGFRVDMFETAGSGNLQTMRIQIFPNPNGLVNLGSYAAAVPVYDQTFSVGAGDLTITDTGQDLSGFDLLRFEAIGPNAHISPGSYALHLSFPGSGTVGYWTTAGTDESDCAIVWGPSVDTPQGVSGCSSDYTQFSFSIFGPKGADCNGNGIPDECDIADGESDDCNANGIPDDCDLASGLIADCNSNGTPDECDVDPADPDDDGLVSADCNANGIPDECEADCNNDGTPDQCEIEQSVYAEHFDAYAQGSDMHGQGGWKGWDNNPAFGAPVAAAYARTAPHSVDISGSADLVHLFAGATAGRWTLTAWQYIPASFVGESFFVLLNTYNDGGPNNWSTQVRFNSTTQEVISDPTGAALPLITDQWVTLRVEIDLDANTQTFFYGDQQLSKRSWTDGLSGFGVPEIAAVDLFANGATSIYYDDISLVQRISDCNANGVPDDCDLASGTSQDCNASGIPDECEAAIADCNANGIPDDCEPDCDSNGTIDACEIVSQPRGFGAFGIVAQDVPLSGPEQFDTKEWDDFTLTEDTLLTTGRAFFTIQPGYSAVPFFVEIAEGPGGIEAGELVFVLTIGDYDDASGVVSFDFGGIILPAGTWWISVSATGLIPSEQQVFWRRANVLHPSGSEHWFHNFGGGFGVGTNPIPGADFAGAPADLAWALDAIDCDDNGIPDECELTDSDCNLNEIPDACDVSSGMSGDCNANGVPDECDIVAGTSQDCQPDAFPDECQVAESEVLVSQQPIAISGYGSDCSCESCGGPQVLADDFIVSGSARVGAVRFWGHYHPGDPGPEPDVTITIHEDDAGLPGATIATYVNPATQRVMTGEASGPVHRWRFDCILDPCLPLEPGTYWVEIHENTDATTDFYWEFSFWDVLQGVQGLAYAEECPAASWTDFSDDLAFELFDGPCAPPASDCNSNSVPDECDPDCNANGSPDDCDIAAGTSEDCNSNGIPDYCDVNVCPPYTCGGINEGFETGDFTGWQVQDLASPSTLAVGGSGVSLFGFFSNPTEGESACLHGFSGLSPGTIRISQDFTIPSDVATLMFDYRAAWVVGSGGDRSFSVNIEPAGGGTPLQTDVILVAAANTTVVDTGNLTGAVDLSAFAGSVVHVAFEWDVQDTVPLGGFQLDNIHCQPATCFSPDCNSNGTPDECEPDCNANGIADECDIASSSSFDADFNGIPDECEGPLQDCNGNGIDDLLDIAAGNSGDCNNNGIPDDCDIDAATSADCNNNGLPDECEPAGSSVPSGFALDFDGVNDHVLIPSTPDLRPANDFTIEVWVNLEQLGATQGVAYHDENGGGDDGYTLAILADGRARFSASNANGFGKQNVASDDILSIGQWHHLAGVYDNSVLRVYVDGQETSKVASGDVVYTDIDNLNLGRRGGTNSPNTIFFSGQMDEMRFWNVVRSPAEIAAYMTTPLAGEETGLVGYWKFDEGSGSTAFDSASTHDGILVNGPLWVELPSTGSSVDCNFNGVPDECDIAAGTSADADADGIPDECGPSDCNSNGIPDEDELAGNDCNDNGIPDECDLPGDADGDGAVTFDDWLYFTDCMTGPCDVPICAPPLYLDPCCWLRDFDDDGDVDLRDYAVFVRDAVP